MWSALACFRWYSILCYVYTQQATADSQMLLRKIKKVHCRLTFYWLSIDIKGVCSPWASCILFCLSESDKFPCNTSKTIWEMDKSKDTNLIIMKFYEEKKLKYNK